MKHSNFRILRIGWDAFALRHCDSSCLVKDLDGNRIHGLFHHMKKGEHDDFEGQLTNLRALGVQCQGGNVYAGKYFSVVTSGRGEMQFTHKRLGPFQ